jgi:NAD(P) transhydrogenase
MDYDADLVVIGSGPAGEKGAVQAAYFGKRVVLIERDPLPGGTAVHTGTLPSKSFRETARDLRRRGGATSAEARAALIAHKDAVRFGEVARIRDNLDRHRVEVVEGAAHLVGPHEVAVNGRSLTAARILVATGSRPHRPENIDFDDPAIDDSDSIICLDVLPERLAVIGGGVIGAEYACLFAELGVEVTLIESRPRLLPWLDWEISERLAIALGERGVDVRLGCQWSSATREGDCIVVRACHGEVAADRLFFAAGRTGASRGLGLEALGVEVDGRDYIRVDDAYRTAVPSVLAAGDVIGAPALASTSMEQGRVAVCRAFGFDYKRDVGSLIPTGIYTIPEVAAVGVTEGDARAQRLDIVVGRASYSQNARGRLLQDEQGGVKLIFERASRRLIGVHVIGEMASETVHLGHAVMALGGTVETLIDMVFNYPTLAESYKYAAYDALGCWD